jgi:PTH1 family peptidyl-tRNA hydrolase
MKIIVALGNPGKDYENTRHNAGCMAADEIKRRYSFDSFRMEDKFESLVAAGQIGGEKILLVKPQTFMNASGRAVSMILSFYKLHAEDLLVMHDDLDIPIGEMRVSFDSRSAGHRGVQSIIDCLGTQAFKRLRIGIKMEGRVMPTEKFVLAAFTKGETEKLNPVLEKIPTAIEKELMG